MINQIKLKNISDVAQRKTVVIAGLLYLIISILGPISELIVRSHLIVYGDATVTAYNIKTSEGLFLLGIVSSLVYIICFLLLVLAIYNIFKSVNKKIASLMVIFVIVCVPIMFINLLNSFAVLLLLSGADYLTVFDVNELNALAMLFINLYNYGYTIAQIFHGLWLFPFGYLVYKSGFSPKFLGGWLIIGCFGYLIDCFMIIVLPNIDSTLILYLVVWPSAISEILMCFWFVFKSIKWPKNGS